MTTKQRATETKHLKHEIRKLSRNAALLFVVLAVLTGSLFFIKGNITGFQSLQTFDSGVFIAGSSQDSPLKFSHIPNMIVKVGQEVNFEVQVNRAQGVIFTDDTKLFNITTEGTVRFTPTQKNKGYHRVFIIVKTLKGEYYFQDFAIQVEN